MPEIRSEYRHESPQMVRELIREGKLCQQTSGMCIGYAQGNLVILPKDMAYDFLLFAMRNKKPCPILEVTEAGGKEFRKMAPGSDLYKDIPLYRVYKKGVLVDELPDITDYYRKDFVAFLIGCSFSFENALMKNRIPVRHIQEGHNVPMYITNIQCESAGVFSGPMTCSMRPIPNELVVKAVTITGQYPNVHGSPIHIGDPAHIGIKDINKPDFGDPVTINEGETPVFWACGVTPQSVALEVKPEIMITHSPGYMFITDIRNTELAF